MFETSLDSAEHPLGEVCLIATWNISATGRTFVIVELLEVTLLQRDQRTPFAPCAASSYKYQPRHHKGHR